jgi:hypothetical protein
MVSEDDEVTRFQHVAEMLHGLVNSQKLPIVGVVFLLCRVLQHGTHGGSGEVCDKCKLRGRLGARQ